MCIPHMVEEILGILPAGALGLAAELTLVALHLTGVRTACPLLHALDTDNATLGELHVALVIPLISRLSGQLEVLSCDKVWKYDSEAPDDTFLRPFPPA